MPSDRLSLVQITDCHLLGDPSARLNGVDTAATLDAAIDHILNNGPEPDAILATGDLSQDGTAASYNRMKALLARFHPQRQFWHDAWAGTRLVTSKPMSRR